VHLLANLLAAGRVAVQGPGSSTQPRLLFECARVLSKVVMHAGVVEHARAARMPDER
jgi:hypothetical protein